MLYLNRPEWKGAFLRPRYPVALGRSQDLFAYTEVRTVELGRSADCYLEHTLAPFEFIRHTTRGVTVLMCRFVDYQAGRFPTFERYVVLKRRVFSSELLHSSEQPPQFWIDPTSQPVDGKHLGLIFHSWIDADGHDASALAQ